MAQDGSRWPQVVQDSLLGAFLGLQTLSWKALDPQKTYKNQWFDVRFAFALPSLCFSIAFALPSLFLFLSNEGLPSAIYQTRAHDEEETLTNAS